MEGAVSGSREPNEFDYRPVSTLAIGSLVLGLASLLGIFLWVLMPLGLLAIALGFIALATIQKWKGQYAGSGVAITGIVMGGICLLAGGYVQVTAYRNEVPAGFRRVSFSREISTPSLLNAVVNNKIQPAPAIEELLGKKIFFKGFVYPTGQDTGITSFLLLKDSEECCFGGDPAVTDMVRCDLPEGAYIHYMNGRVSVAGTFKMNPGYKGGGKLQAMYLLDCEMVTRSQSDF